MGAMRKKRPRRARLDRTSLLSVLDGEDRDGFGAWVGRYLEWLAIHNYSKHTVRRREELLIGFSGWCRMRGIMQPRDVTKPVLERYQKHLFEYRKADDRPLCFASQSNYLSTLRSFFSWLVRQNALLWNPASEIDLPRTVSRIPRAVLTADEVEVVLAQIDIDSPYGVRDRAMVEMLYSTGIRRSELLGLDLSDFDGERGMLLIREGKGKKDRMVPIGPRAIVWVDKYLSEVRPDFVVNEREVALFLNIGAVTYQVRQYVKSANVGKTGSCHLFRHTMATLMLEGGADVRYIQQMLGHASLDSTEIYTRVSLRMLKAVHAATHPASKAVQATPASVSVPAAGAADLAALVAATALEEDGE
jgi:integrase/recombinase XerD